ncbi:hypothetical protein FQY83_06050 [Luteimonas marina]|uniref:Membrane-associated oxidoreductase n=1 Tax=Luteimonas marina TaxID=488485 RepID=A0A5C5UAL0_9GAMM|nr:hypothetical protein [Luteimonas marina]TWT22575.1 hypothetical protein FQY83_06050 [Luteimonas marina]
MDSIEKDIFDNARRGEWYGEDRSGPPGLGDDAPRVSAGFLRSLLLGTHDGGGQLPLGVRLRGVIIDGCLDLRDACGPGDSGLPPLLLRNCVLPGRQENEGGRASGERTDSDDEVTQTRDDSWCILADHAMLSRFSLHDCRSTRISLKDASVQSELELIRVAPLDAHGECQFHAPGIRVDGSIRICGTHLQIRDDRQAEILGNVWQYACHLTDAEINGDLLLQPNFKAVGGINLSGARIDGSIWGNKAEFDAAGLPAGTTSVAKAEGDEPRCAFRAQRLRCTSAIVLTGGRFAGGIDFLTADVGWLQLKDVAIPSGGFIGASNARVTANIEVSVKPQDNLIGFTVKNSCIGDDLIIQNLPGDIDASLAHVGGDLKLTLGATSALRANIDATSIEVMGKASLDGMVIPRSTDSSDSDNLRPPICFNGGKFHGGFVIKGLTIFNDSSAATTLSLDDATISRAFQSKGTIVLQTRSLEHQVKHFEVEKWRDQNLSFYGRDWHLLEVLGASHEHGRAIVSFLRKKGTDQITVLDGGSHRIYAVNKSSGLALCSDDMAKDYLKFFCAHVWGDLGAFHIEKIKSCTSIDADCREVKADVHYGEFVYESDFRVHRNGFIEMTSDAPLEKKAPQFRFKPPYRIVTSDAADPIWIGPGQSVIDEREVLETIRGRLGPSGKAKVSLRGVHAGVINHSKDSFGDGVTLALEGLVYGSLRPSEEMMGDRNDQDRYKNDLDYYKDVFLNRQFSGGKPNKAEYKPQPYEQLSRVLRDHGEFENARDVTLEKLKLDREFVHKGLYKLGHWLLEVGFKHGLGALRGASTCLLFWFVGVIFFNFLNQGGIGIPLGPLKAMTIPVLRDPVGYPRMVVDAIPVSPLVLDNGGAAREIARDPGNAYGETWCGDQMDPLWFALDVMVPLLDLKHEGKCDVSGRDDAWVWRFLKSLYAIVGAIVTSIFLLAISGVLRRRVET